MLAGNMVALIKKRPSGLPDRREPSFKPPEPSSLGANLARRREVRHYYGVSLIRGRVRRRS